MDKASATETVDLGLTHSRIKPKTRETGIQSLSTSLSAKKESLKPERMWWTGGQMAVCLEDRKVSSQSPVVMQLGNRAGFTIWHMGAVSAEVTR